MMPKRRQGDVHNDASAAMTQQQWQQCQGNDREDASAAMAMMPKWPQGDIQDDASAGMMATP
jgi:hypothetical protein